MALTLVFGDDFNSDHSASYTFAASSEPSPLQLASGHLNLDTTGNAEWQVSPTGVSVSGSGVAVFKFHFDAGSMTAGGNNGYVNVYWGADGPNLNANASSSDVIASGDGALFVQAFDGTLASTDTTATVPSGAFTGWLVSIRNGGNVTTELWTTDPGGGGSALATVSHAETAGDVAQLVALQTKALGGGYVDYWNLYSGTGTIPVQDVGGGSSVPSRDLVGVGT